MKQHITFFIGLLFFAYRVNADCSPVGGDGTADCRGATVEDFQKIPKDITKLTIYKMNLGHITSSTFAPLAKNLTVLELSNCEITKIDDNAFSNLKLTKLSIDNCGLQEARATWFESSLTSLSLKDNQLMYLDDDVFENLSELRFLDVSGNEFTCLPLKRMSHMRNLTEINITYNSRFWCWDEIREFTGSRNITLLGDSLTQRIVCDNIFLAITNKCKVLFNEFTKHLNKPARDYDDLYWSPYGKFRIIFMIYLESVKYNSTQ